MGLDFRIASPCTADWNRMKGDDRVRHCEQCNLNVYNFAELTYKEIEELVAAREGRLCVRLYKRADGNMITKDCPVGFQMKVRRVSRIAGAALSATMTALPMHAQTHQPPRLVQIKAQSATVEIGVADPSGAVVQNATVRLTDKLGTFKIESQTDSSGRAQMLNLHPGVYELTVESQGFRTSARTLTVSAGDSSTVEVRLDIGEVLEGGVMFETVSRADYSELPLPTGRMPALPLAPDTFNPPPQSWFQKFRAKLHL
jgi:hypothetical protein